MLKMTNLIKSQVDQALLNLAPAVHKVIAVCVVRSLVDKGPGAEITREPVSASQTLQITVQCICCSYCYINTPGCRLEPLKNRQLCYRRINIQEKWKREDSTS